MVLNLCEISLLLTDLPTLAGPFLMVKGLTGPLLIVSQGLTGPPLSVYEDLTGLPLSISEGLNGPLFSVRLKFRFWFPALF